MGEIVRFGNGGPVADTAPGTVSDVHQLLAEPNGPETNVVDVGEYFRARMRAARKRRLSMLEAQRLPWARLAGANATAILLSHEAVALAEGSPWPDDWGAGASIACVAIAFALGILFAAFLTRDC